jgi:hypothetical protein
MPYSATRLRQNLYAILDSVLEKGQPVEIERKGHILRIVPEERRSIWERLEPHRIIKGDPEDLVSMDWTDSWSGVAEP